MNCAQTGQLQKPPQRRQNLRLVFMEGGPDRPAMEHDAADTDASREQVHRHQFTG